MKNKLSEKLSKFFEKFREDKKLQIGLIFAVIIVVIAVYFIFINKTSERQETEKSSNNSTTNYVSYIENKLESTILSISGVKNVNVNVSLETGFEYVYATKDETKTTSSGTLSSSDLILVSGEPVLLKEIYPKVQGVVVVVNEVELKTRLEILQAIQTVLEISNEKITIIS